MSFSFDPVNLDHFDALYKQNLHMEGFGIEAFRQHWPCPFCAAADFAVTGVLDLYEVMSAGATCTNCGRTSRWGIEAEPSRTTITLLFVSGPEPPEFMPTAFYGRAA